MQGQQWHGSVRDILAASSAAGLNGVELTMAVAAPFLSRPKELRRLVGDYGLRLACVRYSMTSGFTEHVKVDEELRGLERAIDFTCSAGCERLGLKGPTHHDPHIDRRAKEKYAYDMYNGVARKAQSAGLTVNVHLHSHPDSIIWTPGEWARFLRETDPEVVLVCGDTGHLLRCGHDPAKTLKRHLPRISHVHLKDAAQDGSFLPLGEGTLNLHQVINVLLEGGYRGWLVLEEEHASQVLDPAGALARAANLVRIHGWRPSSHGKAELAG